MTDQAEHAVEAWAQEDAQSLKRGVKEQFKVAVRWSKRWADGESDEWIADQVTAAGFTIGKSSVNNYRLALEGLPVTGEPSTDTLGLFHEALMTKNNPRGGGGGGEEKPGKDPYLDWLAATHALEEEQGDEGVAYAVSLLALQVRENIHQKLHEKEGVDE